MEILVTLIVGAIVGWLASVLMKAKVGLLGSIANGGIGVHVGQEGAPAVPNHHLRGRPVERGEGGLERRSVHRGDRASDQLFGAGDGSGYLGADRIGSDGGEVVQHARHRTGRMQSPLRLARGAPVLG